MVARGERVQGSDEIGEEDEEIQTTGYKISHGDVTYIMVTVVDTVIAYLKMV